MTSIHRPHPFEISERRSVVQTEFSLPTEYFSNRNIVAYGMLLPKITGYRYLSNIVTSQHRIAYKNEKLFTKMYKSKQLKAKQS